MFELIFKEFGLPHVIRTDNGVPFASARAIRPEQALRLVARLGIQIERSNRAIRNKMARDERMHLALKDLTCPFHDQAIAVAHCGSICFNGRRSI